MSLKIENFDVVLQVTQGGEVIHEETLPSDEIHPDSAAAAMQKGVHKFISDACGSTKMSREDRIAKLAEYRAKLIEGTLTFSIGGSHAGVSLMTFAYRTLQAIAKSLKQDPKDYGFRANGQTDADFGKAVKALSKAIGKPKAHQRLRDHVMAQATEAWKAHQAMSEKSLDLDEILSA